MKIARYSFEGRVRYGVVRGKAVRELRGSPFRRVAFTGREHPLSQVRLLAPATPSKILAVGLNYASHLTETRAPENPEVFFKVPTCVIGPGEPIVLPKGAGRVDEEAELVVVIGRRCSKVPQERALEYVLGYTCGNDVSARVWQRGDRQWWRAKSSDTFGPVGPFIESDIDGSHLNMWARVNGREVQRCNTSEMLFHVPALVNFISRFVTLEPGDLIFTGTSGVPAEIKAGDVVEVEIQGIGILSNPVKAEE